MKKKLFVILIIVLIIYSAVKVATPYYNHYAFKSDLEELLRVSVSEKPEEVMAKIMELVNQYHIPVQEKDIILEQKGMYVVKASWQETVDFFTVYQKTFDFYIDTSK